MKKGIFYKVLAGMFILMSSCSSSRINRVTGKNPEKNKLYGILQQYPQFFDSILQKNDEYKVQIIYTQIDRNKEGIPGFTDYSFNVNKDNYYYPASTVKLPVAALALQKLNELKVAGLDTHTTMITETDGDGQTSVDNDPTSADGRPTIAHYIKKILLVSDNDAFNRLYEFLGQEYINNNLHKMGYEDVQIIHRLSISLTEEQNRHTNPVKFFDSIGRVVYQKPADTSRLVYAQRTTKVGNGYMMGDKLVSEPFDFSKKNRFSLTDLHGIVRAVLFPETISSKKRFNLTKEDYDFLHRYMSMMPQESKYPAYDSINYWDTYVKFLLYGSEKGKANPGIRIFNKVGDAYGFLIDGAYVADFENNIEFMLSAVVYCNSDGIFNDDKYDYDSIGLPFMKNLGRVIYDHELKRERKYKPDLSALRFEYK
jgi:Beta-lactamase enzyme family